MNRILGVDPGLTGAVAVLNERGNFVEVLDMPVIKLEGKSKVKKIIAAKELHAELLRVVDLNNDAIAAVEQQSGMPLTNKSGKQLAGAASTFSLGQTYGSILSAVAIAGIKQKIITPKAWKGRFNIMGGNDGKKEALTIARLLFPSAKPFLKRVKDHNRAEALLIARYYWEVFSDDEVF